MDIDSETGRGSAYLSFFDISNNFAWRDNRPQEIERRRVLLGDNLIYDSLLKSGNIRSPDVLYPPRDEASLVRLLEAIEGCSYDGLKKDCIVYYLLKWHQDGREDKFAIHKCIAPQFTALADAYWHLDSGINIARGVAILADARLNRDFASKILQAISLSPNSSPLIRKYVRTAKPPLTEPDDIQLYTLALADSSLLEAWQYQRTFQESSEIRPRLLQKVLEWCVFPKPRPSALMQLLSLPLSSFEESTLHKFVLQPPNNLSTDAVAMLQDLICVRLIQLGRYIDAIRLDRIFSNSKFGLNTRQAQERTKMVQDLYNALPAIQRAYIDVELSDYLERSTTPTKNMENGKASGEDVTMSQSWEDIRPSDLHLSTPSKPQQNTPSISERSNAPRFGGPIPKPSVTGSPLSGTLQTSNRQNFPLVTVPTLPTNSPIVAGLSTTPSGSRSRQSLSNTASRLAFSSTPHISSPLSGIKFSPVNAGSINLGSSKGAVGHTFVSATRQQNAFYTPPPPKPASTPVSVNGSGQNGYAQSLFGRSVGYTPGRLGHVGDEHDEEDMDRTMDTEEDMDRTMNTEELGGIGERSIDIHDDFFEEERSGIQETEEQDNDKEERNELGFSVFGSGIDGWMNVGGTEDTGNGTPTASSTAAAATAEKNKLGKSRGREERKSNTSTSTSLNTSVLSASTSAKRKVPGGFEVEDDEDEDMEGQNQHSISNQREEKDRISPMKSSSKFVKESPIGRSAKKPRASKSQTRTSTRTRTSKEKIKKEQEIPGSLFQDQDQDHHEDVDEDVVETEVDDLPPLRVSQSNKPTSKKSIGGRTSRGSTSLEVVDELSSTMRRTRRSSRLEASLSGNSGVLDGDGDASPKKATSRARKSTSKAGSTTTTSRKKRG